MFQNWFTCEQYCTHQNLKWCQMLRMAKVLSPPEIHSSSLFRASRHCLHSHTNTIPFVKIQLMVLTAISELSTYYSLGHKQQAYLANRKWPHVQQEINPCSPSSVVCAVLLAAMELTTPITSSGLLLKE